MRLLLPLLLLAACRPAWTVERSNDGPAYLGVIALGGGEAWIVGASDAGDATILHRQGGAYTRVTAGVDTTLWWIARTPGGTLWSGGENATVLRSNATGGFEKVDVPATDGTIYGIWAAADDDVWLVGGRGSAGAFVWRYDGTHVTAVTGLPDGLAGGNIVYKVWGNRFNDVWFCGSAGLLLHWDGAAFTRFATNGAADLLTVSGDALSVFAVGSMLGGAALFAQSGDAFVDRSPTGDPLAGLSILTTIDTGALGVATGANRSIYERAGDTWVPVPDVPSGPETLHSVSIAPDLSEAITVGGIVAAAPYVKGLVLHRGP